jgi:hypothetical protein
MNCSIPFFREATTPIRKLANVFDVTAAFKGNEVAIEPAGTESESAGLNWEDVELVFMMLAS